MALREYALAADGERGAVIGPRGDLAWMCVPSWESRPVFGGLLAGPGTYSVSPGTGWYVWGGYYEEHGLIWRSRYVASGSVLEVREALARPAAADRAVVLRRCHAVRGDTRVDVRLDVRDGLEGPGMSEPRRRDGEWTARAGSVGVRWTGAADAVVTRGEDGAEVLSTSFFLKEGEVHDLVLELGEGVGRDRLDPDRLWEETEHDWRRAVPSCLDTLAPRDSRLAYGVLTGLTASSGAMVAAATTALPERANRGRNYDYRYAWIRDQCYAGQALAAHGGSPALVERLVAFVADRVITDGAGLHPAYTVAGREIPPTTVHDVAGYPGADAVTGNRASTQFQLDALGEALALFAAVAERYGATTELAEAATVAAAAIHQRWTEPEAGIWELDDAHWTHSRLACVAGLRSAARVLARRTDAHRWEALAGTILTEAAKTAVRPDGAWRRAPGDDRVDAALLLPPLRGALPAADPRTKATLQAVREELVQEGFVYRFRQSDRPLEDEEGAFTLCGFFTALAEYQQGEPVEAHARFERIRSSCATSGLFTEEFDVHQRQLRGNLPQAFVHALLLETSTTLRG